MIFLTWAFRHASGGAVGALAQAIARGLDHGVGENRIGVAPSGAGTGIEGRAEALREGAEERIAKEVVMLALDAVGDVAASEGPQVLGDSVKGSRLFTTWARAPNTLAPCASRSLAKRARSPGSRANRRPKSAAAKALRSADTAAKPFRTSWMSAGFMAWRCLAGQSC